MSRTFTHSSTGTVVEYQMCIRDSNYVYCGFDRRGAVRYENKLCGFDFIDKEGMITIISSYEARTYCIIGNIHDNPELLKGGGQ